MNILVPGILHDVIDDAGENLRNVEQEFGDDVAGLVDGVSKLSYINQVMLYRATGYVPHFLYPKLTIFI